MIVNSRWLMAGAGALLLLPLVVTILAFRTLAGTPAEQLRVGTPLITTPTPAETPPPAATLVTTPGPANRELALRAAIVRAPRDGQGYAALGAYLAGTGRSAEALAAYREALALGDTPTTTYAALGDLLHAAGAVEEAISAYEAARQQGGAPPVTYLNLAAAYANSGRLTAARRVLEDGLSTYPNHARLYFTLGEIAAFGGDTRSARSAYAMVIWLAPDGELARQAAAAHRQLAP